MTTRRRSLRHRAGDVWVAAAVRAASLVARVRRERVVHMLHIRKTGGTAIKAALTGADLPVGLRLMLHPHRIALRDVPRNDEVFFFLRDPVARFVSGFESRRREGRPAHFHPWTPAERRAYERFETPDALALALTADDASRNAAEQAMNGITHVRSRLSDWLGDERLIRGRRERIVLVGWQETLDHDFARLVGLLGLETNTRLPDDEVVAHRSATGEPRPTLSETGRAAIREWYADDYRLIDALVDLGLTEWPT